MGQKAISIDTEHPLVDHLRAMVSLLRSPCFTEAMVGKHPVPFWDDSEEEAIQAAEAALEEYGG